MPGFVIYRLNIKLQGWLGLFDLRGTCKPQQCLHSHFHLSVLLSEPRTVLVFRPFASRCLGRKSSSCSSAALETRRPAYKILAPLMQGVYPGKFIPWPSPVERMRLVGLVSRISSTWAESRAHRLSRQQLPQRTIRSGHRKRRAALQCVRRLWYGGSSWDPSLKLTEQIPLCGRHHTSINHQSVQVLNDVHPRIVVTWTGYVG